MDYSNGVKWGIIGAGDVCEVKSGPALQNVEGSELISVMRRNAEKAEDFAKRHGVPKWTNIAEEVINDPDVNAIYIATPPSSHEYYVKLAAVSGKAIYVEKPMAMNNQECLNMIAACEKHNAPLFVAYYRRYLPMFLHAKNLIDGGMIGDIRAVNIKVHKSLQPDILAKIVHDVNWRVDPAISGGGYFMDLAAHQLDLLDLILGPIIKASGFASNQADLYTAEDQVVGSFAFANGTIGNGSWLFNLSDNQEEELTTFYGSEGSISFSFFSDFHIDIKINGEEAQRIDYDMPKHIQQPLIESIVNDLRGGEKCVSTGVSGARTNWVLENICVRVD